nr:unnamed protein product [Haemonchus contortus]
MIIEDGTVETITEDGTVATIIEDETVATILEDETLGTGILMMGMTSKDMVERRLGSIMLQLERDLSEKFFSL